MYRGLLVACMLCVCATAWAGGFAGSGGFAPGSYDTGDLNVTGSAGISGTTTTVDLKVTNSVNWQDVTLIGTNINWQDVTLIGTATVVANVTGALTGNADTATSATSASTVPTAGINWSNLTGGGVNWDDVTDL